MMNDDLKENDRNASSSAYGWVFQVGAGIILMLDNIKNFNCLKMEGEKEDIEILCDDGVIYAQAKSVTQMEDNRNAGTNLKNALKTLNDDFKCNDYKELIYITNISHPFGVRNGRFEYNNKYDFSVLPKNVQKKIISLVDSDFPIVNFKLQTIYFFGEKENKFSTVKDRISEFLREALDDPSYKNMLFDKWFALFMGNCADKPQKELKLELEKKEILWPIIVLVVDNNVSEKEFANICDFDNSEEIEREFYDTIYRSTCDVEFVISVLGEYNYQREYVENKKAFKLQFIQKNWKKYEHFFTFIYDSEKREALIKLLLLKIINGKSKINHIKEATNL